MKRGDQKRYLLTQRDIDVILVVYKYRYLSTSQLQLLHFPSRRVTNRRLRVLAENKFLDQFKPPFILGEGRSEYVFSLGDVGADIVSLRLKISKKDTPPYKRKPKDLFYINHLLDINQFRIYLELACQNTDISLYKFIPDYEGKKTDKGGVEKLIKDVTPDPYNPNQSLTFVPDGVFILENSTGKQILFFLEIDRATGKIESEEYQDFLDKIIAYLSYLKTQGFKRYGESFTGFRVLITTTSKKRLLNLKRACSKLGVRRVVWVTVFKELSQKTIFEPIWQIADLEDEGQYSIIGGR